MDNISGSSENWHKDNAIAEQEQKQKETAVVKAELLDIQEDIKAILKVHNSLANKIMGHSSKHIYDALISLTSAHRSLQNIT